MKKFTSILAILFIVLTVKGQNLQQKIEKVQEKFSFITKQSKRLNSHQKTGIKAAYWVAPDLKSAAATEKLDSIVTRLLNLNTDVWENDWKDVFFYDAQMRSTLWNDFEWNIDNEGNWEQYGKTELDYNNEGYISSMTFSYIDENSGIMTLESKV